MTMERSIIEATSSTLSRLAGRRDDMVATGALLRERTFAEAKRICYAGLDAPTLLREVTGRLGQADTFRGLLRSPPTIPLAGY